MIRKKKNTNGNQASFRVRSTDNSGASYRESHGYGIFSWVIDGREVTKVMIPLSCECCGHKTTPSFGPYLDESE